MGKLYWRQNGVPEYFIFLYTVSSNLSFLQTYFNLQSSQPPDMHSKAG